MSSKFKDIWSDPVWSKVIAGFILTILLAIVSLLKGWISDTETIPDVFSKVFTYKVKIWIAIAAFFFILIVMGIIRKKREARNKPPVPPFVNDFTKGVYQGQMWRWRWQWSRGNKFYYLTDLSIVCPVCNEGLLTLGYMDYKCGKCGAEISFNWINVTNEAVAKQILEEARKRYDYYSGYIGKLSSGILKA